MGSISAWVKDWSLCLPILAIAHLTGRRFDYLLEVFYFAFTCHLENSCIPCVCQGLCDMPNSALLFLRYFIVLAMVHPTRSPQVHVFPDMK